MSGDTIRDRATTYASCPTWLMQRAGGDACLLYLWLKRYAGRDGHAFPSRERLAKDVGVRDKPVSTRTIDRLLRSLRAHGALVVRRRGRGLANEYELVWDDPDPTLNVSIRPDSVVASDSTPVSNLESTPVSNPSKDSHRNDSQVTTTHARFARDARANGDPLFDVEPTPAPPSLDAQVVFDHWLDESVEVGLLSVQASTRFRLTPGRAAAIKARLKAGYTADELMMAVSAGLRDEYTRKNRKYCDLSALLDKNERVDRYVAQAQMSPLILDRVAKAARDLARIDAMAPLMSGREA